MTTQRKMRYVLLLAIVLLLAYEAYGIYDTAPGDTISEWVWHFSQSTIFVFAGGCCAGHFFWQRKRLLVCPTCKAEL